jgi:hypothetical protein
MVMEDEFDGNFFLRGSYDLLKLVVWWVALCRRSGGIKVQRYCKFGWALLLLHW